MKVTPLRWTAKQGWSRPLSSITERFHLVLYFCATEIFRLNPSPLEELRCLAGEAVIAGCSTAGEIHGASVVDDSLSALLISFASTQVRAVLVDVSEAGRSGEAGTEIGRRLSGEGLAHIVVLSDGLRINGSVLTDALRLTLPPGVQATGGLAGDGSRFQETFVGLGADVGPGKVLGIGFYGSAFRVSHGSAGGWIPFGPKRLITKATGNVLYRLDDQAALPLYKKYLAERAAGLPATGLLFPLEILADSNAENGLVRTILAVDEKEQSLTFAGDMPEGHYTRLMRAGCDALVDGAGKAADLALPSRVQGDKAAILVSCVGRKLVMGQRVEEEVEAVLGKLGAEVQAIGFYSYGEIAPTGVVQQCELHNQTMTLTLFGEAGA